MSEAFGGERLERVERLAGGNSNETYRLVTDRGTRVLRRPPAATIDSSAHSMEREHQVLCALADTDVPTPRPLAMCTDRAVIGAPFFVMEWAEGRVAHERLPAAYGGDLGGAGVALMNALASLHRVRWRDVGLTDFGRPEGFLERQVGRWQAQYARYQVRDLPLFDELAQWLEAHRPPDGEPGILHGDFHADNCLLDEDEPRVTAILDWEMATIGDPLLDVGMVLAFWGDDRPRPYALPRLQEFSRGSAGPSREALADRYATGSGRSVEHLQYYLALALWKLAAIVEGAYARFLAGAGDTPYARALEHDVPALLEQASRHASRS
jgi:aminoglycoside phosphotransferase (APT) family kinase protein